MKKTILTLILLLAVTYSLMALGAFNSFNMRNHPELNWKEIETEHCRIVYHDPLIDYATESAKISESTYQTFMKLYKIDPKDKMILYISDQDNIPNGATVMTHYIFIWVNQNDFPKLFTGNDKWLKKVISHEMSHWFVFHSMKDWMSPFLPISLLGFPQPFHEGYAQFFSGEPWGLNRGDRYVKTSVLSQKQDDPSMMYYGGLIYGIGFAMIRYLATNYGEDSLIQLLQYRNKSKLYNFGEAFKKVYKKDFKDFYEEFRRYIYTYYYGEVYQQKAVSADTTAASNINDFQKLNSTYRDFDELIFNDKKVLFSARKTSSQGFKDLVLADVATDSLSKNKLHLTNIRRLEKSGSYTSFAISPNNQYVAWTRYTRHQKGRLAPRIYAMNLNTGKKERYGEGNFAAIDNQGGIYFQKMTREENQILYIQPDRTEKAFLSLKKENQLVDLKLSPDNTKLMFSLFDQDKEFKIIILNTDNAEIQNAISLHDMPQNTLWLSNDELLFSVENSADFCLESFTYNLTSKEIKQMQTPPFNVSPLTRINDEMIALAEFYQGGMTLGKFKTADRAPQQKEVKENYYNKWIFLKPSQPISDSTDHISVSNPEKYQPLKNFKWRQGYALPFSSFLFGSFVLSEPLGKHMLIGGGYIPYKMDDQASWVLYYQNTCFYPTIQVISMNSRWIAGYDENDLFYQVMKKTSVSAQFPVNLLRSFTWANLGLALSYNDLKNESDVYSTLFETKNFTNLDLNLDYGYSLPWINNSLHPVRSLNLTYKLQTASDKLGMNLDYNQHSFDANLAFAPLLFNAKSEQLRTLSLETRNHYEFVNGNQIAQFMPGVDEYELIQFANKPAFKRYYLRGYEETRLSKKIFNSQNEIRVKLTDQFNFMAGLNGPMISTGYAGVALWSDYTKIDDIQYPVGSPKSRIYRANGYEFKLEANIFGLNTIHKYGVAYKSNYEKLCDYYLLELPFPVNF